MSSRLELLHSWTAQLQLLLPDVRVTRVRVLALFSLGLLWSETTALGRIAASLPCGVQHLSTERRLRRYLANRQVRVAPTWQPLLGALLTRLGQREVRLVFDPTPYQARWTLLMLTLVVGRRSLPIAWHIVPQQTEWAHPTWRYLERLGRRVNAAMPADTTVTLLADRGLTSAGLIDLCARLGWRYCLRLTAGPGAGVSVRHADGVIQPIWDLATSRRFRWTGTVAVFREAGWRKVELTIHRGASANEPWLLISDRPAGRARVTEYRQRCRCEAFYQDSKTRSWQLQASRITDRNRLNRLLLVLALAVWWATLLGQQVIRRGLRHRFDRTDRRDLSLIRLGRRWVRDLLEHHERPPLPFRYRRGRWQPTWAY